MASKRCSSIKLLSLTFVSKSISKSLLINNLFIYKNTIYNNLNVQKCVVLDKIISRNLISIHISSFIKDKNF